MNTLKKLLLRIDLNGLWLVCWVGFTAYYWVYMGEQWNRPILFITEGFPIAALTGLFATFILRSIGFFDLLRVVPRKSDFLLVLFAMALAALVRTVFSVAVFGNPTSQSLSILLTLPVYAALFFVGYGSLTRRISPLRKRRITLRLRADEAQEFVQILEEAGLKDEIEVLTASQVLGEFAKRRRPNRPNVDLIVFSRAGTRDMQADRFLLRAHLWGIPIMDRRQCVAALTQRVNIQDIDVWSYVSSALPQTAWIRFGRLVQELLEPLLALALLVLFAPLFLVVAALIKMTSQGPVFYAQRRTGYMGKIFILYKFRSMRTDSEVKGYQWAKKEDPRVTPIGKFLRKTRLDELPQLWNVARREMGFVGPRPERPEIYRDLKAKIPLFSLRTDVRPGITGWAQVCAGYAASIEESEIKLEHDLYYIQHMSLRLDLVVMLMTAKVVLFGNEFIQAPKRRKIADVVANLQGIESAQHPAI
jgi:lipopolysaccharide/colanic/teichoic acid biosynthesis glycosyltransferase